jgi:HlyD family secretion protein
VKASVDELDISKIKIGQTVLVTINAIPGKTFNGAIESISTVGTTSNNVTTYPVTISLNDKTGVMSGMNANVTIQVESKKGVVAVPIEALVERNGRTFVMVPSGSSDGTTAQAPSGKQNAGQNAGAGSSSEAASGAASGSAAGSAAAGSGSSGTGTAGSGRYANGSNGNYGGNSGVSGNTGNSGNASGSSRANGYQRASGQGTASGTQSTGSGTQGTAAATAGQLVEVKIGMQNQNMVEITEGISEGQKVMVLLPQASSTSSTNNNKTGSFGSFGGGLGGAMGNAARAARN